MTQEQLGPVLRMLISVLPVAFIAWAGVVWKASENLSEKFDSMMREFREYSISVEHRITKLEKEQQETVLIVKMFTRELDILRKDDEDD